MRPPTRAVPSAPRRRLHTPLPAAVALVGLVAAGCAATTTQDPAVLAVLADRADRVAGHLEAEADCDAIEEAEALLLRTYEAAANDQIGRDVADQVAATIDTALREVRCEVGDPDAVDDPEGEPADDAAGEAAPDDDAGGDGDGGDEAPDPDPAPADDASTGSGGASQSGGSSGSSDASDAGGPSGRGPDGTGPPGQTGDHPGKGRG
jgi:exodeoxyribonuclease V alpha subunit